MFSLFFGSQDCHYITVVLVIIVTTVAVLTVVAVLVIVAVITVVPFHFLCLSAFPSISFVLALSLFLSGNDDDDDTVPNNSKKFSFLRTTTPS